MKRRDLLGLACAGLGAGFPEFASGAPRRIGFLLSEAPAAQQWRIDSIKQGLKAQGIPEGAGVTIDLRSANGDYAVLDSLAEGLVASRVELVVAFGSKAAVAMAKATRTIPIVVPVISDPVAIGMTGSLARPTRNLTGSATLGIDLAGKRLELLREVAPKARRVALLVNEANITSGTESWTKVTRAAAERLQMTLLDFPLRAAGELPGVLETAARAGAQAAYLSPDTLFQAGYRRIAAWCAERRIPSIGNREYAEAGGLVGYGADDRALYVRGAHFVARILGGARVADLPVEQASRFELILNRGTARRIGLPLPEAMALRADEILD